MLIDFLNITENLNIKHSILDVFDLNSNNWFAGFIDADGYFI